MNQFKLHTNVYLGRNALERLKELPIRKACVVCDPFLVQNGGVKKVTDPLDEMGAQWELFDQVIPNPTVELVSAGVAHILEFRPDTVIALGGGSAIDTGKAISFIYTKSSGAAKPRCIAIPTTSGTGSEVTSFSVLSDPEAGAKYPLVDDVMLPEIAMLDPALTITVPPHVTADTGMDVLTHAVEAYASPAATDFTDALAEKAFALVLEYLPRAFRDGQDCEAREKLHSASCMAGMAFNNATLGLCHGMAHAMGELLHLPHGRSNALLLPHVIAFNSDDSGAKAKYAKLARLAGCCCHTEQVAVQGLVRRITGLMNEVGIAHRLTREEDRTRLIQEMDRAAKLALEDRCTAGNCRSAVPEQIKEIYQKIL